MKPLSSMPMSVQSPPTEDEFELEEEDEEAEYASPPVSPSLNRRESRPPSTKSRPGSLRPDSRVSNDASSLCNSRPNSGVSSMRSRPTSNMSAMNSRSKSLSRINGKQSILQRSIIVSKVIFADASLLKWNSVDKLIRHVPKTLVPLHTLSTLFLLVQN